MLNQGPELAALVQTKLTLVVTVESGHNPRKVRQIWRPVRASYACA